MKENFAERFGRFMGYIIMVLVGTLGTLTLMWLVIVMAEEVARRIS